MLVTYTSGKYHKEHEANCKILHENFADDFNLLNGELIDAKDELSKANAECELLRAEKKIHSDVQRALTRSINSSRKITKINEKMTEFHKRSVDNLITANKIVIEEIHSSREEMRELCGELRKDNKKLREELIMEVRNDNKELHNNNAEIIRRLDNIECKMTNQARAKYLYEAEVIELSRESVEVFLDAIYSFNDDELRKILINPTNINFTSSLKFVTRINEKIIDRSRKCNNEELASELERQMRNIIAERAAKRTKYT